MAWDLVPQTALAFLVNVIRPTLGLGDHEQLMFGMSFGYPTDTAVNEVRTERAALAGRGDLPLLKALIG